MIMAEPMIGGCQGELHSLVGIGARDPMNARPNPFFQIVPAELACRGKAGATWQIYLDGIMQPID